MSIEKAKLSEIAKESLEHSLNASGLSSLANIKLPKKEIVKNLIKDDNPSMSSDDINIQVDGFKSSEFKPNIGDISAVGDQANSFLSGILDTIQSSDLDPGLTNELTGVVNKGKGGIEQQILDIKKQADTQYKRKMIKDSLGDSAEKVSDAGITPMSEDNPFYKKATKISTAVLLALSLFARKVIELIIECVLALINIVTSIPGGILMLMPMAFNVPGMITLIISVIQIILTLKSKYSDVIAIVPELEDMFLIFPEPVGNVIAGIVNTLYDVMKSLCGENIRKVGPFINKAKEAIICNNGKNLDSKGSSEAISDLKDYGYIYDTRPWPLPTRNYKARTNYKDSDDINWKDEQKITQVLDIWNVTELGTSVKVERKEKFCDIAAVLDKIQIDDVGNITIKPGTEIGLPSIDLKELLSEDNIKEKIKDKVKELEAYVYDVELPNGKFVLGLSEDQLQYYINKYNVIYSSNTKYNYTKAVTPSILR